MVTTRVEPHYNGSLRRLRHFELVDSDREVHTTPSGNEQRFIYCWLRRRSEAS
jgi:hypothetical protein